MTIFAYYSLFTKKKLGQQKMDNKLKMINEIEKLANYTVTALTNLFGQIAIAMKKKETPHFGQPI